VDGIRGLFEFICAQHQQNIVQKSKRVVEKEEYIIEKIKKLKLKKGRGND